MKKLIIFVLLAVQVSGYSQRHSGFRLGSSLSTVSSTRTSDPLFSNFFELQPSLTFLVGYSWNILLTTKTNIQLDLIYNRKGSEEKLLNPNYFNIPLTYDPNDPYPNQYTGSGDTRYHYFSIPFTFSYILPANVFLEFGAEPSISLSYTNLWDFGIIAGTGYHTKYADISLRYIHGLLNSYPTTNVFKSTDKNRTFQLTLTVPVFKQFRRNQ